MSDSAAPGWYHAEGDPPNTERFWDGFAWTEGPRPIGGSAGVAPPDDAPTLISPDGTPPTGTPPAGTPPTDMPITGSGAGASGLDAGFPSIDDSPPAGSYAAGSPNLPGAAPGGFATSQPPTSPPPGFPPSGIPPVQTGGFPAAPSGGFQANYVEQSQATTSLLLSIAGFFCCGLPAGVGVAMAYAENKGIQEGRRDPANKGVAITSLVIGGIALVLWGGFVLLLLLGRAI